MTIKSLEGVEAADFGNRLFAQWGVGHKADNRGLLILLAISDRKYWVEVGYGLEPILPDGKVGGFGREMVPVLRKGDYSRAILQLTGSIAQVIASDRAKTLDTLSGSPAQDVPADHNAATSTSSSNSADNSKDSIPWVYFGILYLGWFLAAGIALFRTSQEERKKYLITGLVLAFAVAVLGYLRGLEFLGILLIISFYSFGLIGILVTCYLAKQMNRSQVGWGLLSFIFGSLPLLALMHLPAKERRRSNGRKWWWFLSGGSGGEAGGGAFGSGSGFGGFGGGSSGGGGAGGHW